MSEIEPASIRWKPIDDNDAPIKWCYDPTNMPVGFNALSTREYLYLTYKNQKNHGWYGPAIKRGRRVIVNEEKMNEACFELLKKCVRLNLEHGSDVMYVDFSSGLIYMAKVMRRGERFGLSNLKVFRAHQSRL